MMMLYRTTDREYGEWRTTFHASGWIDTAGRRTVDYVLRGIEREVAELTAQGVPRDNIIFETVPEERRDVHYRLHGWRAATDEEIDNEQAKRSFGRNRDIARLRKEIERLERVED